MYFVNVVSFSVIFPKTRKGNNDEGTLHLTDPVHWAADPKRAEIDIHACGVKASREDQSWTKVEEETSLDEKSSATYRSDPWQREAFSQLRTGQENTSFNCNEWHDIYDTTGSASEVSMHSPKQTPTMQDAQERRNCLQAESSC